MLPSAIIFPGQGSQSVGMLADIAAEYPVVVETFKEASDVLGFELWELVQKGPATDLNKTVYTQPALLAGSYAIWRILMQTGNLHATFLAGHSLGEYTALVCAKSIVYADAIRLVYARGQLMQDAVPEGIGAMAAIIGLDESSVKLICEQAVLPEQILAPANFNSIGQVVIAGHLQSVNNALNLAKEKGAKLTTLLPVSVPSHCALMKEAANELALVWEDIEINKPTIPVLSNANVKPYESVEQIREGLAKQLYSPVRWVENIQYLAKHNVTTVIECGPGKVLAGLNKRIDKTITVYNTADLQNLKQVLALINERSV